eukprot:4857774-Alexandrium_andersonii.AAC.1
MERHLGWREQLIAVVGGLLLVVWHSPRQTRAMGLGREAELLEHGCQRSLRALLRGAFAICVDARR